MIASQPGPSSRPGARILLASFNVERARVSFAVAALVVCTGVSGTSPASASPARPTVPRSNGCSCDVPAAHDRSGAAAPGANEAAGNPALQHRQFPGNANTGGQGQSGVPQAEHPAVGNGNGRGANPVAPVQAPVVPGAGNGHGSSRGASHAQPAIHTRGGDGGPGLPHGGRPSHGDGTASAQPPRAAARRGPPSPLLSTTPTAAAPASNAPTPPVASASASPASQTTQARRPRISRARPSSRHAAVRRRARSNPSRRSNRLTARGGAGAPGPRTSAAAAARADAASSRGTRSRGPDNSRTPSDPRRARSARSGDGVWSMPLAVPRTIDRLVRVVPTAVWLALLAALAFAAAAAAAAVRAGWRSRRQTRAIAVAEQTAATDPLTGVLNRRGFGEAVERELARARRHDHPFTLAYLDVRGLKAINDNDGHLVGDQLIKQVAKLLHGCARGGDVVGRLGGDEFALLLAEQTAHGAASVAARLRAQVPARRAALGTDVAWDITIGTASYPEDGDSFRTLLSAADRRLYAQRGIHLRPIERTPELTAAVSHA
jgi:diguanylate cyclase (GGDEF)-like protein